MTFSWHEILEFMPGLLMGARITVILTFLVMFLGLVWGLVLALGRLSRSPILRLLSRAYVEIIRGTPLLLQLFYVYYVLPFAGVKFDPFTAGTIALSANYAAYLSEVYRAGIQAIDRGQIEASLSLGMSRALLMRRIVLPQAVRIILPPIGNYFISLFKDTSLVSIITLRDLMFSGEIMAASTFKDFEIFTTIAVVYLIICFPSSLAATWLERQLKVGVAQRPGLISRMRMAWGQTD